MFTEEQHVLGINEDELGWFCSGYKRSAVYGRKEKFCQPYCYKAYIEECLFYQF